MNSQEVIDYINARIDTKSLKDIATEVFFILEFILGIEDY